MPKIKYTWPNDIHWKEDEVTTIVRGKRVSAEVWELSPLVLSIELYEKRCNDYYYRQCKQPDETAEARQTRLYELKNAKRLLDMEAGHIMAMIDRIEDNIEDFQDLDIDPFDVVEEPVEKGTLTYSEIELFSWDNRVFGSYWVDIGGTFMPDTKNCPKPDIAMWPGPFLMLSPKSYDALQDHLAPYGELLPITIDGETWHLFNCLTLVDADESRSESLMADGHWLGIKKLTFKDGDTSKAFFSKQKSIDFLNYFPAENY